MSGTSKGERKKKHATLTFQFEIKCGLKQGEFVRVANFFEANVPAKHENTTCGRKANEATE